LLGHWSTQDLQALSLLSLQHKLSYGGSASSDFSGA
jgi:hypothetical protein